MIPMRKRNSADWLFFGLCAALAPVMALLSLDFGATWDDFLQQEYAKHVYNFYASGFQDRTAQVYSNLYLYGGLFEFFDILLGKALPLSDEYAARHVVNALFGWGCILITGLLARRLWGSWAGVLAVVFTAGWPRFFGHCMNNSKDIPFAVGYVLALYALSFVRPRWPYVSWKSAAAIVGAVAFTLNIRTGGFVLFGYVGGLFAWLFARDRRNRSWSRAGKAALVFAALVPTTIVLGAIFWPWALSSPFLRPLQALREMANFLQWNGVLLFDGQWLRDVEVPRRYILQWYAIAAPLPVLAGALSGPFLLRDSRTGTAAGLLAFAVVFPVVMLLATHTIVYDGLRHMLFIYPPLAALAAGAWVGAIRAAGRKRLWFGVVIGLVLTAGMWDPLRFHVMNHPNQVVYFNPLVGGIRGAFARYELDYWGACYKQAADWVREQHQGGPPIAISAQHGPHIVEQYASRFPELDFTADRDVSQYHLWCLRDSPAAIRELVALPEVVHRVEADGVPLCLVLRNAKP